MLRSEALLYLFQRTGKSKNYEKFKKNHAKYYNLF